MRTYTHRVIGYLLDAKRPPHAQRLAIIGNILPDVFLELGFVPLARVLRAPGDALPRTPKVLWNSYPRGTAWVFGVDPNTVLQWLVEAAE